MWTFKTMQIKLFEIRDRATFIPAMATKLESRAEEETFLLSRAGFGLEPNDFTRYVFLTMLEGMRTNYDVYNWTNSRTMGIAHQYIIDNWSILKSGDVICVETILGEIETPKSSERLDSQF